MPEECGDFVSLSPRLDPCNGDVRAERSGLTAETELVKKLLSLFKDEFDLTPALANSYPDDIHPLEVREGSGAIDLKGERWKSQLRKGSPYFLKFRRADVPEKFQSQVNVLLLDRFQISSDGYEGRHDRFDLRQNFLILKIDRDETASRAV